MKLHQVKLRTWVQVTDTDPAVKPETPDLHLGEIMFLDRLEDAYTECRTLNNKKVHPVAWLDVEIMYKGWEKEDA